MVRLQTVLGMGAKHLIRQPPGWKGDQLGRSHISAGIEFTPAHPCFQSQGHVLPSAEATLSRALQATFYPRLASVTVFQTTHDNVFHSSVLHAIRYTRVPHVPSIFLRPPPHLSHVCTSRLYHVCSPAHSCTPSTVSQNLALVPPCPTSVLAIP
eukprot:3109582-Rhodomonas_salina.2